MNEIARIAMIAKIAEIEKARAYHSSALITLIGNKLNPPPETQEIAQHKSENQRLTAD